MAKPKASTRNYGLNQNGPISLVAERVAIIAARRISEQGLIMGAWVAIVTCAIVVNVWVLVTH